MRREEEEDRTDVVSTFSHLNSNDGGRGRRDAADERRGGVAVVAVGSSSSFSPRR